MWELGKGRVPLFPYWCELPTDEKLPLPYVKSEVTEDIKNEIVKIFERLVEDF